MIYKASQVCIQSKILENHAFLDVRNPGEWKETGIVQGAIQIPLAELEANIAKIPKNKTIHVYCKTGGRAKIGMSVLLRNGVKDVMITEEGGFPNFVERNLAQIEKQ